MPKDITITERDLEQQEPVENTPTQVTQPASEISPKKKEKTPKKPSKIKIWWQAREPWQKILTVAIAVITVLGIIGGGTYYYVFKASQSPLSVLNLEKDYVEHSASSSFDLLFRKVNTKLPDPSQPRTEESPLNGALFTTSEMKELEGRRPVAVMVNNHSKARPQSGLASADIVYEAVTESGITRHMAIFWSQGPDKAGPIRSARQYYLEWMSPFDPLYIHDGCASTFDPRTDACGNIYAYGIKDLRTYSAWRVTDRVAPHNEYVSITSVWDYAKTLGWDSFYEDTPALKFKRDAQKDDRGTKTHVKATFRTDLPNGGAYDSEWTYDATSNSYLHRIGGQADLDIETGKQVTAKTVIAEEVPMISAGDGFGRVIITTTGEGKAYILQDGKIVQATWKKPSRTDRTKYYDSNDNEIELNRGRLWIMEVPRTIGKFDIIEQ